MNNHTSYNAYYGSYFNKNFSLTNECPQSRAVHPLAAPHPRQRDSAVWRCFMSRNNHKATFVWQRRVRQRQSDTTSNWGHSCHSVVIFLLHFLHQNEPVKVINENATDLEIGAITLILHLNKLQNLKLFIIAPVNIFISICNTVD